MKTIRTSVYRLGVDVFFGLDMQQVRLKVSRGIKSKIDL